MFTGATKLFFNMQAGFSAIDYIDGLFFLMYAILLTQYGFYMWNEQQISRRYQHDESLLSFKLSEYYSATRDFFLKKMKQRFVILLILTYFGSFWCFAIITSCLMNPVNSDGKLVDTFTIGFAIMSSQVICNHAIFMGQMRDWNKVTKACTITVVCLYFFAIFFANFNSTGIGEFKGHMFEVVTAPVIWLTVAPTTVIMVMPFWLERYYWRLVVFP